jgi:16S rRNA (cytosine967-C5)-methyltransferase
VRAELPEWASAPLRRAFGDDFDREVAALLETASVDLRVNEARAERDEVIGVLGAAGIEAKPTPMSPLGLRLTGRPQVAAHPAFRSGLVEVQDEGSQIVGLLVDAKPGQQVVDFCSGAGGKALLMAARMQGRGRIVACDVSEGRLTRAKERIRRAVVDNIEPKLLESERDRWVKKQKGKFDRVLIDAPCSGTGAWRRNPDARWRPTDLARLTALQAEILDSAARLAKPGGGRVVYATCSLLREENEDQVERFLASHAEWRILPVAEVWPDTVGGTAPAADGPYLRLTPARHGTDGFFVAILERGEAAAQTRTAGPALAELERDDIGPADSDASAELEEALAP